MKDYRVTLKVRNNRILKAIEESGGAVGGKWCESKGLAYVTINHLINMTISPLAADGTLTGQAIKLCDAVNKLPEELWSNEQLYPLEKNFSDMEMSHEEIAAISLGMETSYLPDFSRLENSEARALMFKALETLTPRERQVIIMRFYDEHSLHEVGRRLDVTFERVRQVEAKALRKLRHPSIARIFIDTTDDKFAEEWHKKQKLTDPIS